MNNDESPYPSETLDRLEALLDVWEESTAKGESLDPELLCVDCPELLPEFTRLLTQLRKTDWLEKQVTQANDTQASLSIGQSIVPGYVLEALFGTGGFGQVWRASGPGGVQVALKCLWLGEQRTRVEWKALSRLKALRHPHLLGLFGYWISQGWLVVGSELATGSLADKYLAAQVTDANKASQFKEQLLGYLKDAAEGLDYLHSLDTPLIHGDVKPGNLLLVGGRCKVGDFGLIRQLAQSTVTQAEGLTLKYAAPEALVGNPVLASDQFSLAMTYCHLVGVSPFHGEGMELAQAHLHLEPDLTGAEPNEASVLSRALDKRPEKRYPTCSAFVMELSKSIHSKKTKSSRSTRRLQTVLAFGLTLPLMGWAAIATAPVREKALVAKVHLGNTRQIALPDKLQGSKLIAVQPLANGNLMALGSGGAAFLYDAANDSWQESQDGHDKKNCCLISPVDGQKVYSGQGSEPFDVEEWKPATRMVMRTFSGNSGMVRCLDVSTDSSKLATGSYGGEITVYDLKTGQADWSIRGKNIRFQTIHFTRDGSAVVYSAEDGRVFFSRIGNNHGTMLTPKKPIQHWGLQRIPGSDRFLLGGTDGKVTCLDLDMKQERQTWFDFGQSITAMAIQPESGLMIVGTGDRLTTGEELTWEQPLNYPVYLVDTKSGKLIGQSTIHSAKIRSVAWSMNGRKAYTTDESGKFLEWAIR
jgi:hypothetical protein